LHLQGAANAKDTCGAEHQQGQQVNKTMKNCKTLTLSRIFGPQVYVADGEFHWVVLYLS